MSLAERTGGAVVNADSAQIYRDLPIVSAAPGAGERARADHRLYGIRDANDPCSAADWAALTKGEIAELHKAGRLPILVGGTGLYLRTLLEGIAPVPDIDPKVRERVRRQRVEENRSELRRLDPAASERLNAKDTTRIARALEVVLSTGRTLADWQLHREGGIAEAVELKPLILLPPRPWLYGRCDARFEQMIEAGAIDEVERLLDRNLDPSLPAMRAIGVREIADFLSAEIDRDEMIARGKQATRNYAKRQYTWFAHQPPPEWPRFTQPLDETRVAEALALFEPTA